MPLKAAVLWVALTSVLMLILTLTARAVRFVACSIGKQPINIKGAVRTTTEVLHGLTDRGHEGGAKAPALDNKTVWARSSVQVT